MFGKPKMTAEEIVKAIAGLPDEEKKKIYEQSFGSNVDESVAGQEKDANIKGSQSSDEKVGESEGEEATETKGADVAEAESAETSETATMPNEEAEEPSADEAESEKQQEVDNAQEARIAALESKIAELMELVSKVVEVSDSEFGQKSQSPAEEDESIPNDEKIMNKYYKNSRNYK